MATKKTTTEKKKTTAQKRVKKTKDVNIAELEKSAVKNLIEQTDKMTNEVDTEIVEAVKGKDFMDLIEEDKKVENTTYEVKADESVVAAVTGEKTNTSVTEAKTEEAAIGNNTEVITDEKVGGNYKEKPIYKKKFDYNSFWLSH